MALIASATVESQQDGVYTQQIETGGHQFAADEPVARGGADAGPAPYGLLLAALGSCTAITLRMYAARKGWSLGPLRINLRHTKTAEGGDRIERELVFGGSLSDEQRARLTEIADKTPVTRTLTAGTLIETRLG